MSENRLYQTDIYEVQLADIIGKPRSLFILCCIKSLLCTRRDDFLRNYEFTPEEIEEELEFLAIQGFVQEDGADLVLTDLGERAIALLDEPLQSRPKIAQANLSREAQEIQIRFKESRQPEATLVEKPLVEELVGVRWEYIDGLEAGAVPDLTLRKSFKEVLLKERLRDALQRINGKRHLEERHIDEAINRLEHIRGAGLMERNKDATTLLLKGWHVPGDPTQPRDQGKDVDFIDFTDFSNNEFLCITQFRVDRSEGNSIRPDCVLFVNGIPVVVIECKSPSSTNPIESGITQLLRYSKPDEQSVVPDHLFSYNQLLISTCFYQARVGTVGATYEQYQEWKDIGSKPKEVDAQIPVTKDLSNQQILVLGMLSPERLIDIIGNFVVFMESGGKTVKIIPRYQQFRAVYKAIDRLQTGTTKQQGAERDQRGGVIWHTQGSGKSLTMVFLVRKMRKIRKLQRFKIILATDREELEDQLAQTIKLIDEPYHRASSIDDLKERLQRPGAGLILGMMQKYQEPNIEKAWNASEEILVLVDEAHRTQSGILHATLSQALPNCAKIGFTGTPVLMGRDRKWTIEIFNDYDYLDRYTILQSEIDGSTVPIHYEGRQIPGVITDKEKLDQEAEAIISDYSKKIHESLPKYITETSVLMSSSLIEAKARDMLLHYAAHILPNGMKAMIVADGRDAANRYQKALEKALPQLMTDLDQLNPDLLQLNPEDLATREKEVQFMVQAYPHREMLRHVKFAAVFSEDEDDPSDWKRWTDKREQEKNRTKFKQPLDPTKQDNLAFLCVDSMLLTGYDAPIAQVLYIDRFMRGLELLQAIARVNRNYPGKTSGLVVDYRGIAKHLKQALLAYNAIDIQGALMSIEDERPRLTDRYRRVMAIFKSQSIENTKECVELLKEPRVRADFELKLKKFLESLDIVLPRPEALPYVNAARLLGLIKASAAQRYRDEQLELRNLSRRVQNLIDQYVAAQGVKSTVERVPILDVNFERHIEELPSDDAKASDMEHELRSYITEHLLEDPMYFRSFSERLETILQKLQDNWKEQLVEMRPLIHEIRVRSRSEIDANGLNIKTEAPFFHILESEIIKEKHPVTEELHQRLITVVEQEILLLVRKYLDIPNFWGRPQYQDDLKNYLAQALVNNSIIDLDDAVHVANELMKPVKGNYDWLKPHG